MLTPPRRATGRNLTTNLHRALITLSGLALGACVVWSMYPLDEFTGRPFNIVRWFQYRWRERFGAKHDVTIGMWTLHWQNDHEFNGYEPEGCHYPIDDGREHAENWCMVTQDRGSQEKADMLVFHGRDATEMGLPRRRIADQPWVYYTLESWTNEQSWNGEFVNSPRLMSLFDLSATYHLDADVAMPYELGDDLAEVLSRPLDLEGRRSLRSGQSPVLWIGSNCDAPSKRDLYIEELMKYIPVDSYGACLHNQDMPDDVPERHATRDLTYLTRLIGQYKFYLAVENSNCPQYVTEKFFNALRAGVLPIVDGPPEGYHGFQPNNHSVITLDAYPDPRDLATLLRRLDADEALYRTYFTYKNQLARESAAGREESGTSSRPSGMPSLVDPLFRQRWLNATANRDRGWCGLCRRAALYKQKRRERLSDAPPLFSDDDIFANRAIPVPEHVMPGLACAARGKFNYIHGLVKARDGG